jgi:isoaspartyl peptidase/L-asparaginase-like protein (Ntn-hydrolase superfamily)
MSYEGIKSAFQQLSQGEGLKEAIATAVMSVEDDPRYISVGYGGLPARDGRVTLDAAYMDGQTLRFGGVLCAEGLRNPIRAAMKLSERKQNCLLAGKGAEEFALSEGLALRDMRTQNALMRWRKALNEESEKLEAYQGHDTVCVIGLDQSGRMGVGTSTSGLFMKMPGRIGDTAIIGSGFYCDARYGGAAATGLGEDIMRGCLSYDAVSLMRRGASPQEACDEALHRLRTRMRELNETDGGMSMIAMDPGGRFGAATTIELFPFSVGREGDGTSLYIAGQGEKKTDIRRAKDEEIGGIASD